MPACKDSSHGSSVTPLLNSWCLRMSFGTEVQWVTEKTGREGMPIALWSVMRQTSAETAKTANTPLQQTTLSLRFALKTGEHDDGLLAFFNVRPRLFGIAYRVLGNAAEAEDIVQDVWLRWQSTNRSVIKNPPAFLSTTTTRLCINVAQSAHSRRETCIGTPLPEPVDTSRDPGLGAERGETLKIAVLVVLEKLSPTERAAYVLREAFDYSYRQIADILRMEEANSRQLVSRARQAYRRWTAHTRQFGPAESPAGGLCRCGAEGRHGRPGRSLR